MTALDLKPGVLTEDSRWSRPLIAFAGLVAMLCLVQFGTLSGMARIWWETATYQHGFLVAPLSLWMVWRRREDLAQLIPTPSALALLPLVLCAAVGLLGALGGINLLQHAGFVGALMALVPLCFGWQVTRALWFPVLFLGFMVPVGDFLIAPLQEVTADASVWLLQLTGVPVYREGLMIELPSGLWEVAEACAGLRFIIANLFVAAIFAYLSYDRAWKWVLFGVLAIAIPVGANCVRAYGIMMIAHLTDNEFAVGVDHLVYGWVFFSFVMLAMLWVGGLFADRRIEDPTTPEFAHSGTAQRSVMPVALIGAAMLASGPALASLTTPQPATLNEHIVEQLVPAGWQVVETNPEAIDRWEPRFTSADQTGHLLLTDGTHYVDLFFAGWTHQREGAEALHYANRFDDDEIWKRARLAGIRLEDGSVLPAQARLDELTHVQRSADARGTMFATRLVTSWVMIGDTVTASAKEAKLAIIRTRLSGGTPSAAVIALSSRFGPPEYRVEALAGIEKLRAALPPLDGLLN